METKQQPKKALVLGGGGTTGTAWEIGLLLGLYEGGIDVTDVDLIIGTSAGSVTGAQITSGLTLQELYALQLRPIEQAKERVVPLDQDILRKVFVAGTGAADAQTARARIGAVALAAQTMSEEERLDIIAERLSVQDWPSTPRLVIIAIDAQTGEWVLFDKASAVPLVLAVAASTAFPGVSPPTTIGGHRYIDGGFRSATNADLAKGAQRVLILSPLTFDSSAQDGPANSAYIKTFEDEQVQLQQAGAQVLVITPDEASVAAKGPHASDSRRLALSARAGCAQGHLLAESVKRFWGSVI
ncbi:MAG: patatin-like phospholipase family protein [Ktedonobacteraceae bacterium]|nr:patatin-like phospholipase family protein [Ktedonobacteraceae bacterium]